jgi:hypothetical protein
MTMRIGALLIALTFATAAGAQQPPTPIDLEQPLPPEETVASLSSRLRLLNGDIDRNLLKEMGEWFKNNPGKSKEELIESLKQKFSGKSLDDITKMLNRNPDNFDFLKNLASNEGGLSLDGLKDFFKKMAESGQGFKPPDFDPSNWTPPKLDGPNLNNLQPPNLNGFKTDEFKLPDGSSKFVNDLLKGWEKNIGKIGDNPEMKKALEGLLSKENGFNPEQFSNWFKAQDFDTKGMKDLFNKKLDMNFKFPDPPKIEKLNWKAPDLGSPSAPSMPSAPSFGGGWSLPGFGGGGAAAAVPALIVIAVIVAIALAWWFWPQIAAAVAAKREPAVKLPENFDPRGVQDRQSLVKAFEILSMLLCGDAAKVWNHATIGAALKEFMTSDPTGADRLAVLYALARYTPSGEPLSAEAVAEARRTLCRLAGVPEA